MATTERITAADRLAQGQALAGSRPVLIGNVVFAVVLVALGVYAAVATDARWLVVALLLFLPIHGFAIGAHVERRRR